MKDPKKSFNDTDFVVVDVETTGLSPRAGDRMVEIAAMKIRCCEPGERFHSLLNPQRDISNIKAFARCRCSAREG